jgi:hypothetical protein
MTRWRDILITLALLLCLGIVVTVQGCAGTWEVLDILFSSEPTPICDTDTAGTVYKGKVCLKYSDGTYRWGDAQKAH